MRSSELVKTLNLYLFPTKRHLMMNQPHFYVSCPSFWKNTPFDDFGGQKCVQPSSVIVTSFDVILLDVEICGVEQFFYSRSNI